MKIAGINNRINIINKQVKKPVKRDGALSFKGSDNILAVTLKGLGMQGNSVIINPLIQTSRDDVLSVKRCAGQILTKSEEEKEEGYKISENGYKYLQEGEEEYRKLKINKLLAANKYKKANDLYNTAFKIMKRGTDKKYEALYNLRGVLSLINEVKSEMGDINQFAEIILYDGRYRKYDAKTNKIEWDVKFDTDSYTIRRYNNKNNTLDVITCSYDSNDIKYSCGSKISSRGENEVEAFYVYKFGNPETIQENIKICDDGSVLIDDEYEYADGEFIRKSEGIRYKDTGENITTSVKDVEYGFNGGKPVCINQDLTIITNKLRIVKEKVEEHIGYKDGKVTVEEGTEILAGKQENTHIYNMRAKYQFETRDITDVQKNISINEDSGEIRFKERYGFAKNGYSFVFKNGYSDNEHCGYDKSYKYKDSNLCQVELFYDNVPEKDSRCQEVYIYNDNMLQGMSEEYKTRKDKTSACKKYYEFQNDVLVNVMEGVNYQLDKTKNINQFYNYDYESEKLLMAAEGYNYSSTSGINYKKGYNFLNDRLFLYRNNYNEDENGNYIMGQYMYFPFDTD